MTRDHRVIIERRGRSHKCVCTCGWTSHSWNELRPAEADAWHHVFGESVIVDVSAIPDERSVGAGRPVATAGGRPGAGDPRSGGRMWGNPTPGELEWAVDELVRHARALADGPSPYTRGAAAELWRQAGEDPVLVQAAITHLVELLARHDRSSAGAADSEWLQLITAKRLLAAAGAADGGAERGGRRALI